MIEEAGEAVLKVKEDCGGAEESVDEDRERWCEARMTGRLRVEAAMIGRTWRFAGREEEEAAEEGAVEAVGAGETMTHLELNPPSTTCFPPDEKSPGEDMYRPCCS